MSPWLASAANRGNDVFFKIGEKNERRCIHLPSGVSEHVANRLVIFDAHRSVYTPVRRLEKEAYGSSLVGASILNLRSRS